MGVKLCHMCLKLQASQTITKQWFQDLRANLSRYIAPLLNEGNSLSFGDDLNLKFGL